VKTVVEPDTALAKLSTVAAVTAELAVELAAVKQHMDLARAEAGCPDDETLVMHCRELRAALDAEQAARKALEAALMLAKNTVECASLDTDHKTELPWYRAAKAALALAAKLP